MDTEEIEYSITPKLEEKFKPMIVKEIIHNVLYDQLSTKEYDPKEANQWTKDISEILRLKIKDLDFKRYKFVVNVIIGKRDGSGVKVGTRCVWDTEVDTYAYNSFMNDSLFCVAMVYAVYHY